MVKRVISFIIQSTRVWRILKKPSFAEFKLVSKISAIGILALGLIGFIVSIAIKTLF